jgi:hypothetical protein
MANLILKINNSTVDSAGGGTWINVDPSNDVFIFSQGSGAGLGVSDGDAIPAESLLNRYAVVLDAVNPVTVPKYFLADFSANLLKEIKLAGNQNKQYVFDANFDGATATEPQLEAWDTISMTSAIAIALGNGTPNSSWYKAIATTSSLPGVNWVGTPLGGSNSANILLLNEGTGALTAAKDLYFNFKIVIPGGYLTPGLHTPVLAIVFTTN